MTTEIIETLAKDGLPYFEDRRKVMNLIAEEFEKYDKAIPLISKEHGKFYLVPDESWYSIIDTFGFTPGEIKKLASKEDKELINKTFLAKKVFAKSQIVKGRKL